VNKDASISNSDPSHFGKEKKKHKKRPTPTIAPRLKNWKEILSSQNKPLRNPILPREKRINKGNPDNVIQEE